MAFTQPTAADFKVRFDRDFLYSTDDSDMTGVRVVDITRGITGAAASVNAALWPDQATYAEAFLLLSAHFLCVNIGNSSQGLRGQGSWLTSSKSVGPVSEGMAIPESVLKSPFLAGYAKTSYGFSYLTMLTPYLIGNVMVFRGESTP